MKISEFVHFHSETAQVPVRAFLPVRAEDTHGVLVLVYVEYDLLLYLLIHNQLLLFYFAVSPSVLQAFVRHDF